MADSPSTVGTIDEDKLDVKFNEHSFNIDTSFMALPPPPSVFNNRQNSIQSNNSKDNEMYSIFSNPNASYNSINESVDSFDQFYTSEYDLNQSFDSIPDSLIDNSTINNNTTSNTTHSTHPLSSSYSFYQVNQNFDSHNQNHNHQNNNDSASTAATQTSLGPQDSSMQPPNGNGNVYEPNHIQLFNSYDNVYDNFDFYPPTTTAESLSPSQGSPSFTAGNFNLNFNLNLHPNQTQNARSGSNGHKIALHKYHSDLSINTSSTRYNGSISNPNSAIPSSIPPSSATTSLPSASTSTPVKLENGNFLQLATFRHNPQSFHSFSHQGQSQYMSQSQPGSHTNTPRSNSHPAVFSHPSSSSTTPHNTISHPPNSYQNSPRRRNYNDYDDPDTPTTTATANSVSNSNSEVNSRNNSISNSISNSPLTSSTASLHSMSTANMAALHNIPSLQVPTNPMDKTRKHTRRRLLPRSKNGCWICRIKHLKCDEVRPSCSSCSKFGISCDYSPEKPLYVSDKNLRSQKLLEITHIRKSNQKLKSKVSKKRLKEIS